MDSLISQSVKKKGGHLFQSCTKQGGRKLVILFWLIAHLTCHFANNSLGKIKFLQTMISYVITESPSYREQGNSNTICFKRDHSSSGLDFRVG